MPGCSRCSPPHQLLQLLLLPLSRLPGPGPAPVSPGPACPACGAGCCGYDPEGVGEGRVSSKHTHSTHTSSSQTGLPLLPPPKALTCTVQHSDHHMPYRCPPTHPLCSVRTITCIVQLYAHAHMLPLPPPHTQSPVQLYAHAHTCLPLPPGLACTVSMYHALIQPCTVPYTHTALPSVKGGPPIRQ